MKRYIPLQLTQSVEEGEAKPKSLGWKDIGPLRMLDVKQDKIGGVRMSLGCRDTRVTLVCNKNGGIRVYRNGAELVLFM